jgi:RNA polymerase sigma-70 factor (ECF subfamily)
VARLSLRGGFVTLVLEPDVIARALAGDAAAIAHIVTEAAPHIERQLLRYPFTEDDRRDLVQTTSMQVLRRLASFRGDSSFSTWLFRVTTNEALMWMRSQRRLRARITPVADFEATVADRASDDGDHPAARLERGETHAQVTSALDALPDDYRDVVVAHYHRELGLEAIARELRISESAVRSRLHRARLRLRVLLEAA